MLQLQQDRYAKHRIHAMYLLCHLSCKLYCDDYHYCCSSSCALFHTTVCDFAGFGYNRLLRKRTMIYSARPRKVALVLTAMAAAVHERHLYLSRKAPDRDTGTPNIVTLRLDACDRRVWGLGPRAWAGLSSAMRRSALVHRCTICAKPKSARLRGRADGRHSWAYKPLGSMGKKFNRFWIRVWCVFKAILPKPRISTVPTPAAIIMMVRAMRVLLQNSTKNDRR